VEKNEERRRKENDEFRMIAFYYDDGLLGVWDANNERLMNDK
jgi:hypothetical protein